MDQNDYDENGRPVIRRTVVTEGATAKATTAGAGLGIVALIVAIALAIAAWFWFNGKNDTSRSVARDAGTAVETGANKAVDAAKEVPQAAKDAVTPGDQPTTRPNADGSTKKLDQK